MADIENNEETTVSMTQEEAMAAIEAVLFMMGESVEISRLSELIGKNEEETDKILGLLEESYKVPQHGIRLCRFDNAVQLSTRAEQFDNLIRIAQVPRRQTLSDTQLETLSIIAYRQPVTRGEIEEIRGVSCEHAINRLLSLDLICELGRRDTPGRPILFGTTEQFLRSFGVQSLDELPSLNMLQAEEFKEQAEEEISERLGI